MSVDCVATGVIPTKATRDSQDSGIGAHTPPTGNVRGLRRCRRDPREGHAEFVERHRGSRRFHKTLIDPQEVAVNRFL
jgi:hypothetical protein